MITDNEVANLIHHLGLPPLSAHAEAIRQGVACMVAQMVELLGCDPADLVLSRGADGNVYVTRGPPLTAQESAARAAALADEWGMAGH